jgi:hypothetical protein
MPGEFIAGLRVVVGPAMKQEICGILKAPHSRLGMMRRPMGCYADKGDKGGNVDKGFDPLHAGQTARPRFRS